MSDVRPVWDATVLERVRNLHLKARHLTSALLQGGHRSRWLGQAVEFAGYQQYMPGMDVRRIDWRVYGRTDRHVVKQYDIETQLPCTLVLDFSQDLGTGPGGPEGPAYELPDLEGGKASYAIVLAATLAYYLHDHGEPVGLEIVAGEGMSHRSLPVRTGRNHLRQIFRQLALARPHGRADLAEALFRVGARTKRRSWVGVITDGMEEPSQWLPALSAFAERGTDIRLFHVYDRQEWRMAFREPSVFFSPEDGEALPVDPRGVAAAFATEVRAYVDEVKRGVLRFGGRYLPVPADLPMERVVRSAVADQPLREAVP